MENKILVQCDKCNGTGKIWKNSRHNYGICGMGILNILDRLQAEKWQETCDKCDGNGVYYIDKNKIKEY